MKVFVFTYDRYDSITTSKMLDECNVPHTVICHTDEAKHAYIKAGNVKAENIIASGRPKGLANNRNFALGLMKEGEWAAFIVDDFVKCVEFNQYDTFKGLSLSALPNTTINSAFDKVVSIAKCIERAANNIPLAEYIGANLIGLALNENPFFLKEKYKTHSLADGRFWLVKKTGIRFDENVQLIDDTCFTAINIARFGKVLVDNWVIPICKRYTAGAYGTKEQRMAQKIKEARYLVEMYGDVVKYADKSGWPKYSHVQIKTRINALKITQGIIKKAYQNERSTV